MLLPAAAVDDTKASKTSLTSEATVQLALPETKAISFNSVFHK